MDRINVKIKVLREGARLPEYKTAGAAGADVRCYLKDVEEKHPAHDHISKNGEHSAVKLLPGQTRILPTGLAFEVPEGYEMQVRTRSGVAVDGLLVLNSPGTVDSDYRGELGIIIHNAGKAPYTIFHNTRLCQVLFAPVIRGDFRVVEELSETSRGDGAYGSTGSA